MNIAIIDDNAKDSRIVEQFIGDYFIKHNFNLPFHIFIYQKEQDFFNAFKKEQFDILFIDYFLEQLTGLQIAEEVRKKDDSVILIFITCSRDYAVESYKVKASGYIVKPFIFRDFEETMALIDNKKMQDSKYIEITNHYEKERVKIKEIISCEIDGHYVILQMRNGQIKRTRDSFTNFIKILKPYNEFLHCYRGCMINMDYVKEITEISILMKNEKYIPIRIRQKEKLLKIFNNY